MFSRAHWLTLFAVLPIGCSTNEPTFDTLVRQHDTALAALQSGAAAHATAMARMSDLAAMRGVERDHLDRMGEMMRAMQSSISATEACRPGACAHGSSAMTGLASEMQTHHQNMSACESAEAAEAEEARHTGVMNAMFAELGEDASSMHQAMCEHMRSMMGGGGMMGGGMMGGGGSMMGDAGTSSCAMGQGMMMEMPCTSAP